MRSRAHEVKIRRLLLDFYSRALPTLTHYIEIVNYDLWAAALTNEFRYVFDMNDGTVRSGSRTYKFGSGREVTITRWLFGRYGVQVGERLMIVAALQLLYRLVAPH